METWLFGDSWHELTNGQGEDAQGGQASAGTVDTPCPLCSCAFVVVGPLEYHVIAGEANAGTSLALSAGHIVRASEALVQNKYSVRKRRHSSYILYISTEAYLGVKYVLLHLW